MQAERLSEKEKMSMVPKHGFLRFWTETGTEGGYWAFKETLPADDDQANNPFRGFHILKDGDALAIFSKDDPNATVWEGTVNLEEHPAFTVTANGYWIHAEQRGIDPQAWADYFMGEYPARLTVAG